MFGPLAGQPCSAQLTLVDRKKSASVLTKGPGTRVFECVQREGLAPS